MKNKFQDKDINSDCIRKNRIMTIVGTRPEVIKLCRVIIQLDKHTEHILVHTGQNYDYELNQIFFDDLNIKKPDFFMNAAAPSVAETIANIIKETDRLIDVVKPDAILIYGDTNSCLSVIAAKRKKIPIFHMEAGNRCFDLRVPEEINRKIVDHLSDINMVISEHARRYLIAEGIKQDHIIKIGSSIFEVLNFYKDKIESSKILNTLGLKNNDYFIISVHREENIDLEINFVNLIKTLYILESQYKKRIIISTHPRTRKKLEKENLINKFKLLEFMKPFGYFDYVSLQKNAYCVISDSGTISEEASLLKFPAITIRQVHERPEAMDEATVIMSGLRPQDVINAVNITVSHFNENIEPYDYVNDYRVESVSRKVVKIIHSYIHYINRVIWYRG